MPNDNTLERAEKCFDGVSRYATGDDLCSTVRYYLGDRIVDQMTGDEVRKLRACLYSLHRGAMKAGAAEENYEHRKRDADELETAASAEAKRKLAWILDNFDNLTTEE